MLVVFSIMDKLKQIMDHVSYHCTNFVDSLFNYSIKKRTVNLIKSGLRLNKGINCRGFTILLTSVDQEDLETVSFLLESGASVNCRSLYEGWTPLHLAAMSCNDRDDIVELLVSNGADVNARDNAETTPLHQACNMNNRRIMRLLIRKGAAIDSVDVLHQIPFFLMRPELEFFTECVDISIKEIAKLVILKRKPHGTSWLLTFEGGRVLDFYISCVKELAHLDMTKFHGCHSYLSVLEMASNVRKLARLTKKKEFVSGFERNLKFPLYGDELRWIMYEAVEFRNRSDVVFTRLNRVLGKYFPDIVTRKLADNLTLKDIVAL